MGEGGEYLFVFNKHSGRVFRTSLMNAGSENGFNSYQQGAETINFEHDFDNVDALLANRLREIHEAKNISAISTVHRRDWANLVAVQLLRTPIVRSTMIALFEHMSAQVEEMFGAKLDMPIPNEDDACMVARGLFQDREEAVEALAAKDMVLFEAIGDTHFRISDRPVTLESSLPFGDTGLTSLGVTVFMPLGQRLMLGLLCPSIRRKLNKVPLEALDLRPDVKTRLIALRHGLATGSVVQLDEAMVTRHNDKQIAGCMRFVYGPTNDFRDAQLLLDARPEIRNVRSSISIGKIGHGPGPRPHMPPGSWLALFGRTESHILEICDVSDSEPLEMTVQNSMALDDAMNDSPFAEIQYYVDKSCRRGMRNVHLLKLENIGALRVQVRYVNPALDSLMKTIG